MYHVAHNHTGNNQNKQASEQKKIEKGIKDYNPRKKPTLINTSKIEINGEIGIKLYCLEKAYSINCIKNEKIKKSILINLQKKGYSLHICKHT